MRSLALVVMETGSAWPDHVNQSNMDVVAIGEPFCLARELAREVCERVARLERAPELAVLACNAETNDRAMDRRVTIARNLLSVLQLRTGHFVLSACRIVGPALTAQLIRIAATLNESLYGEACVTVRFDGLKPQDPVWADQILKAPTVRALAPS
jgi:hypothetical protein